MSKRHLELDQLTPLLALSFKKQPPIRKVNNSQVLPAIARSKKRCMINDAQVIEPCYAKKHAEPNLCTPVLEPQHSSDISAAKAIGPEFSNALLSLHAFTGCDSTSCFVRKGKVAPLRLLREHPEYIPAFTSLGTSTDLSKQHVEDTEAFTCRMYGGKSGIRDINKFR